VGDHHGGPFIQKTLYPAGRKKHHPGTNCEATGEGCFDSKRQVAWRRAILRYSLVQTGLQVEARVLQGEQRQSAEADEPACDHG
jgi:hypothetical protein